MSDTAISNRDAIRPNAIPGRLKSVVLNQWLTISYAGLSSQALDAIRLVRKRGCDTSQAIESLLTASRQHRGELDFLVCSHEDQAAPRLVKIADCSVYEGADSYWIGNADSARALAKHDTKYQHPENPPDFQSPREREFIHRFFEYVGQSRDPNVGGAVVNCLCSEFGHCYQDHAGVQHWEPITIPDPTPPDVSAALHKSGRGSFSYHLYCPAGRGIALVGYYMEQAEIGYLHLPLERDDATEFRAASEEEFRTVVSAAASARRDA